jgi:hypothetical protein
MRWLVVVAVIACDKYEPKPETAEEQDETMIIAFEEMARVARDNPSCERWLEVNKTWGTKRLQMMIERMQNFTPAEGEAFRAKYGARIDAASAVVTPVAQRCIEEARNTPIESINIRPQ